MLLSYQFLPQDDAGHKGDRMAEPDGKSPVLNGRPTVEEKMHGFVYLIITVYFFRPLGAASLAEKMFVFIRWFRRTTAC